MKIFVTGANGYLGSKIFEYLESCGHEVEGGYFGENTNPRLKVLDISDKEQTEKTISKSSPQAVIHVAAVAHGEDSLNTALLEDVNVTGTKNVAQAAAGAGAKIVFLSSIAALHDMPYGISKLKGEEAVKASGSEFLIVRPSVIIGLSPNRESDLTFNRILQAIENKEPVTEDDSWRFQPSWNEHVCEVIKSWLEGKFRDDQPIYPIIPEIKTRYEISRDILDKFGLKAVATHNPRYGQDTVLDTVSLKRNNLPVHDYGYVLDHILGEIKRFL